MEWYKKFGIAVIGVVGGDRIHHFATRTLAEKSNVSDIVMVPLVSIAPSNTAFDEDGFKRLKAAVIANNMNPLISIRIRTKETPQSDRSIWMSGNVMGQEPISVVFAGSNIQKLMRNGVNIQPGYNRIY